MLWRRPEHDFSRVAALVPQTLYYARPVDDGSSKLSNAMAAAAIGVLQLSVAISLAALIFAGPISSGAARASAGFVLGTAIVSGLVGATSKMSVAIAGAQDTAAILVAAAAAAIVATPEITADEVVPTVFVMIAIAGVATGLTFWFLGRFGLTTFVRFLPFPVISGFTAGTGWLLLRGGIEVMLGHPVELGDLADLVQWEQLKFIVPGLVLALVMITVANTRLPNTLVSVAIIGGSVLFHAVVRATSDLDQIRADGWLVGPFADGDGWAPIGPSDFRAANWTVLLSNGLPIVAIVAVSVVGLLLNLSGLENGPDTQIDMNAEIRSAGIANVFGGAVSGLIGYHLLGDIVLGRQIGARGRAVPITIAGMALAIFLIGPDLIGLVPRSVAGGVLAGLGIGLLVTWVRTSLPRMNKSDQALSGLILLSIAVLGVLAGVGAGVVVAAAVFIVKYSRTDPVRYIIEAAGRSRIDRSQRDEAILASVAHQALAFELQGYLFFGSTTGVRRQIDERVADSLTRFVIIDFARVTGIDSTAATGLKAIATQLATSDVTVIWSGVTSNVAAELLRDDLDMSHRHYDLDHAISWCEAQILDSVDESFMPDRQTSEPANDATMTILDLPLITLKAGETLISAGDTDSDIYIVETGTLTAWIPSETGELLRIRQVLPGASLGEIAFSTGMARTATVIADTPSVLRVLTLDRFEELTKSDPAAAIAVQQELLRKLSARLTSSTAMVRDLLR